MSKTETAVEQAQAAIVALGQKEVELLTQRRARAADVAAAEAEAGAAFLDSEAGSTAPGAAVEKVLRLKTEQAALDRAMNVAHGRRLEAIKHKWQAETSELREQAAEKQRELNSLRAEMAPLISRLAKLERVEVSELVLLGPRRSVALQAQLDLEFPVRIVTAERRTLPSSGLIEVEGSGIEALLNKLVGHEGQAPAISDVLNWHAEVQKLAPAEFNERPRTYRLVWDSEQRIDARESWVFCEQLARTRTDSHDSSISYPDTNTARFRSIPERYSGH